MPTTSVYICDPFGVRLADASNFTKLVYARAVNDVGSLTLTLPINSINPALLRLPDGRIEVWRRLDSGREYLDTETTWLMKKTEKTLAADGQEALSITAKTPLSILREPGRFVNYYAGQAQSQYASAPADDQIKQIARENIGSSADGTRDLSAYISIAGDLGLASSVAKSFAWRDCLKVMQEFAQASTEAGVYVAFDIVAAMPDSLTFQTFVGQRGVDHRFPGGINPVILGPEFGNLGEVTLTEDWTDEVTYAEAGGQGEGTARLIASAQDDGRIGASPFGLRESFLDATQYSMTTGLAAEAQGAVRAGRKRTIFTGRILETMDTQYGVHWAWGDYLTAQAFGQSFDCRVGAVEVTVEGGRESINAWLRFDSE